MRTTMQHARFSVGRLVGAALILLVLLPSGASATEPAIVVSGSGWGHGVGLSQYGAKAMATDGATYEQILGRYFTDVAVVPVTSVIPETFAIVDPAPLWIGVLQNSTGVSFTIAGASARLCFDDSDLCPQIGHPGERWRFGPDQFGQCVFQRPLGDATYLPVGYSGSCDASVRPTSLSTKVTVPFKARSYRAGTIRFRQARDGRLHMVFETGVEAYLRGLSEVPESWAEAAIKAQVVTLRSATYWSLLNSGPEEDFGLPVRLDCYCHLRDGAPDSVFRGATGEDGHPNWVAAVTTTAGEVMRTVNGLAFGIYSSSSGGATESYVDVFGPIHYPHLVSVPDSASFAASADNPHAGWAAGYHEATLATTFGFSWVSDVDVSSRNASGSVASVVISGIVDGRPVEKTIDGVEFRTALSLRSTTFDVVVTSRFDDVPVDSQFAGEIVGLVESGITTGCRYSSFCPRDRLTRGQMATFLVRALDLPPANDDTFSDDDGSFFEADIEALSTAGITRGCGARTFCPDELVTRGEMAAFLVRAFDLPEVAGDSFSDDDDSVFEADIEALKASGVTDGCGATAYCPDQSVSREQMAAFIIRALAIS